MAELAHGAQIGAYPYRIIKQLGKGEGGMSIVYLATTGEPDSPQPDELVALKIANVETEHHHFYRATLDNEVEHLRRLRHPGIVHLHRIRGQTLPRNAIYSAQTNLPGKPWFSVMEYLAGGSLADLLKQHKQLELSQALRIGQKVAETLTYIHNQGQVHLDLKPENIVFRKPVTESVDPVLVDFGIAREENQEGLEAGTLLWSPPERVAAMQEPGGAAALARPTPAMDVYALGLLVYRMVAGQLPFGGSRKSITSAILQGTPPAPSQYNRTLPPELDALILAALARTPSERPTAAEFADRIEAIRFTIRPLGSPPPPRPLPAAPLPSARPTPHLPRRTLALLGATVLLLVAVGIAVAQLGRRTTTNGLAAAPLAAGSTASASPTQAESALAAPRSSTTHTPTRPVVTAGAAEPGALPTSTSVPTRTAQAASSPTVSPTPDASPTGAGATATPQGSPSATPQTTPTLLPAATPAANVNLSNFETGGAWRRGDQPNGTLDLSTEQSYTGRYAGKLTYSFPSGGNDFVVFLRDITLAGTPNLLQVWVYGDGSGHFLNAWVRDNGGQTWQVPLGRVSHTGWRQLSGSIATGQAWPWTTISGPDNGAVDYPIRFTALVLDDGADTFAGQGAIYLDDLNALQGVALAPTSTSIPPTVASSPVPVSPTTLPASPTAGAVATATVPPALPTNTPAPSGPVVLINGFEPMGSWRRGDQANGTFEQSGEQAQSGGSSGKLSYNFSTPENDYVVFLQEVSLAGSPRALRVWVYGDGSGHFLNAWIRDNGGQTWQVPLGRVSHTGWRQLSGSIAVGQAWPWTTISGPDNGAVDYPIRFTALVLDDGADTFVGQGAIYLDVLEAVP